MIVSIGMQLMSGWELWVLFCSSRIAEQGDEVPRNKPLKAVLKQHHRSDHREDDLPSCSQSTPIGEQRDEMPANRVSY
jgi:hypothetical protein